MKIIIESRTGHFNLVDPREESISTSIRAYDDEGKIINSCSITSEYEVNTVDFDFDSIAEDTANMIEVYQKRLWLSTSRIKDLEFAKWLRKNKKQIARGTKQARVEQLKRQAEKINQELESINV